MRRFVDRVLLAVSLALGAAGDLPALAGDPPTFSVKKLHLSGVTGRDKLMASFYLLAGKDEVKGLQLLPSDLTAQDGPAVVAANSYQVTPVTVSTLAGGQAVLVGVSVGPVPASGTYIGSIRLHYQGMQPGAALELPLEATVTPKTYLELAAHPSPLRGRVTRAVGPSWLGEKSSPESVTFSLRQKSDGPGRVRVIQTGPLDGSADALPLPNDALSIVRETAAAPGPSSGANGPAAGYELVTQEWTTFRLALRGADLGPGTYKASVVLAVNGDSVEVLPLEVSVRDSWVLPAVALFFGIILSYVVTYMATTGSALLIVLRGIDTLRQRLARPWLLAPDEVADWERRLNMLDAEAGRTPQPQTKAALEAIANEIDQARSDSEVRIKTIRNRLGDLDQVSVMIGGVAAVARLTESPWVIGLRQRLAEMTQSIQDGRLSRAVAIARLRQDGEEVALLVKLGAGVPGVANQPEVQALLRDNWVGSVEGPTDAHLVALIDALKARNSWPAPLQHAQLPQLQEAGGSAEGAGIGSLERLGGWVKDPRHFLPLLSFVLSVLALSAPSRHGAPGPLFRQADLRIELAGRLPGAFRVGAGERGRTQAGRRPGTAAWYTSHPSRTGGVPYLKKIPNFRGTCKHSSCFGRLRQRQMSNDS